MLDMLQRGYLTQPQIITKSYLCTQVVMWWSHHSMISLLYVIYVLFNHPQTHPHICIDCLLNLIVVFIKINFKEEILLLKFPILLYGHLTKYHYVQNTCLLNEACVQEVEGLFWLVRCNTKLKKQASINLHGYFETLTQ